MRRCHNVFALGVMTPVVLSPPLTGFIGNKIGSISEPFMLKWIQIRGDVIHTKSYLIISQRNSYTVIADNVGFVEVKLYLKVYVHVQMFCFVQMRAPASFHITMELLTAV